ncbi:MAG: hypothetical protein AABY64_05940 [Bdellovibrionota bacterium]
MKTNFTLLITCLAIMSFWVISCAKSGEKGAEKHPGSGRRDTGASSKVGNQDILEKNQETFKACLSHKLEDLLTMEFFGNNTLTGKNLTKVLGKLTGQQDLKSAVEELNNSQKELFAAVSVRFDLAVALVRLNKDLSAKEKFLFYENVFEVLFPLGENALTDDQAEEIAKKLQSTTTSFFDNNQLVDDLSHLMENDTSDAGKKELLEKVKSFVPQQKEKIEVKKARVKAIADRIAKKDKKIKEDYDSLAKELLSLSGVLEKKACSQMAIENTENKGDVLQAYLQSLKSMIDLESMKNVKP